MSRNRNGSGKEDSWYWPAGLEGLEPRERVEALDRGWWWDGDCIVTRDGTRYKRLEWTPPAYQVTGDDSVLCPCGVVNYTERIDGREPRLPAVCWRCREPL